MRINKFLSQSGLSSRRKCDNFIQDGLIKVNGRIIKDYSYQVKITDIVHYKNKLIESVTEKKYYILYKPKGYICTYDDPKNRKNIYDLLPYDVRIFSVGRLDYDTTGIILLTNDGDFSNFLCHPKYKIIKKYAVQTKSKITTENIKEINKGILLDSKDKVRAKIYYKGYEKNKYIWDVHLKEGKNREIKRIFSYYDVEVTTLHRYEFAGLRLNKIKEGKYKLLKKNIVETIKVKHEYEK